MGISVVAAAGTVLARWDSPWGNGDGNVSAVAILGLALAVLGILSVVVSVPIARHYRKKQGQPVSPTGHGEAQKRNDTPPGAPAGRDYPGRPYQERDEQPSRGQER